MIRCRILGHDWRPDRIYLYGVCRRCGIPSTAPQPGQDDPLGDEVRARLRALPPWPPPPACEYCNREDGTLYGWHADTWCRDCIEKYPHLKMTGSLDDAPFGSDSLAADDYSTPFIIQVGT